MNVGKTSKQTPVGLPGKVDPAIIQALAALWTRKQVAGRLQTCIHTIARYTKRGWLPCVVINRRVIRYRQEDVERFIEEAMTGNCGSTPAWSLDSSPPADNAPTTVNTGKPLAV